MQEPRAAVDQAPAITQPQPGTVKEAERRRWSPSSSRSAAEIAERAEHGGNAQRAASAVIATPEHRRVAAENQRGQTILPSAMPNPAAMCDSNMNRARAVWV
jgi:hypothetical protein